MAGLTTHVLDTAQGIPAKGMKIRLFAKDNPDALGEWITNADGRCEEPILASEQMQIGQFTLEFAVAAYFESQNISLPKPAFLDLVRVDFGICDVTAHLHVPLLVSPFAYSTYRGS